MRKITFVLDDDALLGRLESDAAESGRTVEEGAIEALQMWKQDMESLAEHEIEMAKYEAEMREAGGLEAYAYAYFRMLEEDSVELREALRTLEERGGTEAKAFLAMLRERELC